MGKRDEIIEELKLRLRALDPTPSAIIEGDGGIWGSWGRHLPAVHLYEQASDDEIVKRGLYQITLPIQIEYIVRLNDQSRLYEEGRLKLDQLSTAIELDERFRSQTTDVELALTYFRTTSEIADVLDGVIGIGVIYNFIYSETFKGYECYRPHRPGRPV